MLDIFQVPCLLETEVLLIFSFRLHLRPICLVLPARLPIALFLSVQFLSVQLLILFFFLRPSLPHLLRYHQADLHSRNL